MIMFTDCGYLVCLYCLNCSLPGTILLQNVKVVGVGVGQDCERKYYPGVIRPGVVYETLL